MSKPTKAWYLIAIFLGILGGIIGYFAVKNRDRKMANKLLIVGIAVNMIIIIPSMFVGMYTKEAKTSESVSSPQPITTQKQYISDDFYGFHTYFFESGLTDIQKEEFWKLDYEDKYVDWIGYVINIDRPTLRFGDYVMSVTKTPPTKYTIGKDAAVVMKHGQEDILLKYSKGSLVHFRGRLANYHDGVIFKLFDIEKGIIVE